jgi:hypothetical protein
LHNHRVERRWTERFVNILVVDVNDVVNSLVRVYKSPKARRQ